MVKGREANWRSVQMGSRKHCIQFASSVRARHSSFVSCSHDVVGFRQHKPLLYDTIAEGAQCPAPIRALCPIHLQAGYTRPRPHRCACGMGQLGKIYATALARQCGERHENVICHHMPESTWMMSLVRENCMLPSCGTKDPKYARASPRPFFSHIREHAAGPSPTP